MPGHPSLQMPFDSPPPLAPKRKMGANEPCWCLSGKKWKRCHKDREQQPPVNNFEQSAAIRTESAKGYCSHPAASESTCSKRIVRAHTVQKRGGLEAIAEKGHVVSTKSAFENLSQNDGELKPSEVGVRGASTFMGFCNRHDTEMFRSIETGVPTLRTETMFLLSFRALAYELFAKRTFIRIIEILRESDKGKPFEEQCGIQEYCHTIGQGSLRGLDDLERWKADYDSAFLEKKYDGYRFFGVAFTGILPIVACGAFHPEFDFAGGSLQRLGRATDKPYQHVTYNVTVMGGRTIAALGWLESDSGPAAAFATSFASLAVSEKAEASIRLGFEHLENIYLKPGWWRALPDRTRKALTQRMRSGAGQLERTPDCLRPDGHSYVTGIRIHDQFHS